MESDKVLSRIRAWFDSPLGQQVLGVEKAVLEQLLPEFFGYRLMQLSIQHAPLYTASPIQHKFSMGLQGDHCGDFVGAGTRLPFERDSMDVTLLHHLLEFYDAPQQILSEVARVTISSGYVVVTGFNPISLWGLCKPVGQLRGGAPWVGNFIRPGRLMDWLNLLNFKIDRARFTTYGLPMNRKPFIGKIPDYSQGISRKPSFPFGAVYVIVARKQVGTMTPVRPVWKHSRALGRLTVVGPAAGRRISRISPLEATG